MNALTAAELRLDNRMAAMERSLAEIVSLLRETRERLCSLYRTVIVTGISSVFAVAVLNYALISSMFAAVGKANGEQLAEMSATLRQMQVQLNAIERAQAETGAAAKK